MEMVLSSSICIFLLNVLVFVIRTRRFLVFFRRQNSRITQLNLIRSIPKCPGGGGGDSACERGGDARRLA